MLLLLGYLLLLNLLQNVPLTSSSFDGDCRNDTVDMGSCSNQTCRVWSLDLLLLTTIPSPADLTHSMEVEVDIQLCSQHSELRTERQFRDLSAVHLAGEGGEVQCIGQGSGMSFVRVHRVWLENIKLRGCAVMSSNGGTVVARAGVFIIASAAVMLDGLRVIDSPGVGVAMSGVNRSDISDCSFTNTKKDSVPVKSGLHITVSEDDTSHTINGCVFTGGEGVDSTGHWWTDDDPPMAFTGAGLRLSLLESSTNNSVLVKGCLFAGNSALDGGAVHITVQDSSEGNSVDIERSEFAGNRAGSGGGAIAVGFLSSSSEQETPPTNNKISIRSCNFTGNSAFMGGAVQLSSSEAPPSCAVAVGNEVVLDDCRWDANTAHLGAAIDARSTRPPQHNMDPLTITLRDCELEGNKVRSVVEKDSYYQQATTLRHGQGTIRAERTKLHIEGHLLLENCTGTALYLESTTIQFAPGSHSSFLRNRGYNGGGVALIGQGSAMIVQGGGSFVRFRHNRAYGMGGAIYQEASKNCFAFRGGDGGPQGNESVLEFVNNTAGDGVGHSVFVHSLRPCTTAIKTMHYMEVLQSIATFVFANTTRKHDVSTRGRAINVTDHLVLVPGREVNLSLSIADETDATLPRFAFTLTNKNPADISVKACAGYTSDGRITLTLSGRPGSEGAIAVSPLNQQGIEAVFNVSLSECPPGYYYLNGRDRCECSADSQDRSQRYIGITACTSRFHASLLHGHWAGYVNDGAEDNNDSSRCLAGGNVNHSRRCVNNAANFRTAYCPSGFCMDTNKTTKSLLLPSTTSPSTPSTDALSFGCKETRTGILCGRCVANHSAFFPRFACRPDDGHCRVGWLYFVLTQILPVTLVFAVVVAFDVSLTSGAVGGLILYAQMFDALLLRANNFLWFEPPAYRMLLSLQVFFRMFNLRFFAAQDLSFCLWEGANALDVLAFHYVTVVYALLLVIFTVKVVIPCVYKLKRGFRRRRRRRKEMAALSRDASSVSIAHHHSHELSASPDVRRIDGSPSIIHGLVGFLVLCYSISTDISLHLLAFSSLFERGEVYDRRYRVFYNGELAFFSGRHLAYAIPATVFLVLITALPPILLLSYPLCYRLLALCGMEESRLSKLLCRAFPLERYKPFFDSFQGAFKDRHRYFAGLYFVYRLVWLLTFAYIRELASFYVVLEVELVVMLALNAYVQPYKENWHNRLDTCVFAILATLNACTIYNYHAKRDYLHPSDLSYSVGTFQVVLAYVPLLCMLVYLTLRAGKAARERVWRRRRRRRRGRGREDGGDGEAEDVEVMEILSSVGARRMSVGYSEFTEESLAYNAPL